MHPQFEKLMAEATALTRSGDLKSAMAVIATAMNRSPAAAPTRPAPEVPDGGVIDVVARVVADAGATPVEMPGIAAQFVAGRYAHRAGTRDYKLFIPTASAAKPRALILMLHGCTQDPDDFARGTRMNTVAAEHNALVLYPAQTRQANSQGCWNWFKHNHQTRGRGEPALLADLALHIAQSHDVDPARIYVAGLSAGGAMAAILASTHPDVFAAAGVHSGLPAGAARDLPGALAAMRGQSGGAPVPATRSDVRMIVFHGDADATVHPINGERVACAHGAGAIGIEEQQDLVVGSRACTRKQFKDAEGRVLTEQWTVRSAGHAWSGGDPSGSYADALGPDASREMMRFFLQH